MRESTSQPSWKPFFFNPVYILSLTIFHVLCIVGIQLLTKRHNDDGPEISRIRQNLTDFTPTSIFVFEENNASVFLAWQYLPIVIVVFLGLLWESLDVTVRRLEPFHQLSKNEGGNTANAMCLDYISMFGLWVPFSSAGSRHFAVTFSSTVYIFAASIIPTLTNGLWTVQWASLSYSSEKVEGPKYATISMNSDIAKAVQAFHGIVAALGLILTCILFFRRTGLYHDPKGIGGIASLISESDYSGSNTLYLFRQIPSYAHSKVFENALQGIKFQLGHMPLYQGNGMTSMTYQLTANVDPAYPLPIRPEDRTYYQNRTDAMGWWLTKRAVWGAEIFLWLGQAAIAGAIFKAAKIVGSDDTAERLKPTIAKMVYTLCITLGGMMWQSIQREVQVYEPWRRLSCGKGRSIYDSLIRSDVISLGLLGSTLLALSRSLVSHWASFCMIMVKIATIFCPPLFELAYAAGLVSDSPNETKAFGFLNSPTGVGLAASAVAVHVIIFCNLLFLLLSGRTRPFLPRRPTTIASQIGYLCRSEKLAAEFAGTSMLSNQQLARKLGHVDRTCRFGWFWWPRGQLWHVGVEEYNFNDPWGPFDFWKGIG